MESFDLAVGLGAPGAGLLHRDVEVGAAVAPEVGLVGRAVVGQDPLDGDAAVGEPGDGSLEDSGRGDGLLVVVDLGIGDP